MTLNRRVPFSFSLLFIAALAIGCQSGASSEPAVEEPAAADASAADVTYEPAYPTDVSEEGLSEDDTAQQQATHSHDGGEEHAHGEGEDHPHGAGEEEHGHDGSDDDHRP